MTKGRFTESDVEEAALAWLGQLGWTVRYGPDIAPGGIAAISSNRPERASWIG